MKTNFPVSRTSRKLISASETIQSDVVRAAQECTVIHTHTVDCHFVPAAGRS